MFSRLAAGELFQRISIESATESQDSTGQVVRTWATLAGPSLLPARVESVGGGESIRGRQVMGETRMLFTLRFRADVRATHRVVYEGRRYPILRAADPYGDKRELRIECSAAE